MPSGRVHPILEDLRGGFVGIALEIATIAGILAVAGLIAFVASYLR